MNYFIAVNGQPTGPYTLEQIKLNGELAHNTLVWNETLTDWTPAGNIPELLEIINEQWLANPPVPPKMPGNYQQQQTAAVFGQTMEPMPKTWLAESILATLFCCLPFGIVGIIKAANVSSEYYRGNYAAARKASHDAGKWTKISFFVGLGSCILYALFWVIIFIGTLIGQGN